MVLEPASDSWLASHSLSLVSAQDRVDPWGQQRVAAKQGWDFSVIIQMGGGVKKAFLPQKDAFR